MLPCENSLAGRVPDIHSLLPDSGLFIVGEHFQRVEHCLLAPARRHARHRPPRPFPCGGARAGAENPEGTEPAGGGRGRHRRRRRAGGRLEQSRGLRHRLLAGRRDVRPADPARAMSRTRPTTPRASTSPPRTAQPHTRGHAGADDHVRLPRPQRAGGAVQGARRVRHQRRQHDQAGKLHAGRAFHRHAVPVRRGGPPGAAGAAPARWRNWRSSRANTASSASIRPRSCAWSIRAPPTSATPR